MLGLALRMAKLPAHDRATIDKTEVASASRSFTPTASTTLRIRLTVLRVWMKLFSVHVCNIHIELSPGKRHMHSDDVGIKIIDHALDIASTLTQAISNTKPTCTQTGTLLRILQLLQSFPRIGEEFSVLFVCALHIDAHKRQPWPAYNPNLKERFEISGFSPRGEKWRGE